MNEPEHLEKWASEKINRDAFPVERNALKEQSARQRYVSSVDKHIQAVSNSGSSRLNHKAKSILHFPRNAKEFGKMVGQVFTAIAVIVGLLGGTGAATVYASQDSLPGEMLYPVKTWSEDVRLDLTADPETKLDLSLEFTDERLAEIQELSEAGLPVDEVALDSLEETLDETLEILAEIPDTAVMDQVMTKLMTQDKLMIQDCDCLNDQLKLQVQDMLQTRIQAVQVVKDDAQYQIENTNQQQYQTPGPKEPLQQQQDFQATAMPGQSGEGQGVQSTPMGSGSPQGQGQGAGDGTGPLNDGCDALNEECVPLNDGTGIGAGQRTRTPMGGGGQSGAGGGRQ
jgi:hypothetical protein